MNIRVSILILLTVTVLAQSCTSDTKNISGKVIELDYSGTGEVNDSDWIKIDDLKFTHYRHLKEGVNDTFALPASNIVYDSLETTGRKLGTRVNKRSIALHLSRYLLLLNDNQASPEKNKLSKYKIINPALASVEGKLRITKRDSSIIKVTTSEGYPVIIKVIE